jgi:putative two-component system response regulator
VTEYTVLVVDDTESNIDMLVDALSGDYDVSVAMDGESALEIVAEEPPDLIVLDIMMPGMDGYEVCEKLKSDNKTKDIPIIFLSGATDEGSKAKALELGAVDYITKPIDRNLVLSTLHKHLDS